MSKNQETSDTSATIVTALALIFLYPLGVIIMWFWPKWPLWVKIILSIPFIALAAAVAIIVANPQDQVEKARRVQELSTQSPTPIVSPKPTKVR